MKIKIFAKERRNGRLHCYTADSLQAFRTLADSATEKGGEVRSIEVESIAETPDAVCDYAHEHNIMLREAPGFVLMRKESASKTMRRTDTMRMRPSSTAQTTTKSRTISETY